MAVPNNNGGDDHDHDDNVHDGDKMVCGRRNIQKLLKGFQNTIVHDSSNAFLQNFYQIIPIQVRALCNECMTCSTLLLVPMPITLTSQYSLPGDT